jgi:hypothetical protein
MQDEPSARRRATWITGIVLALLLLVPDGGNARHPSASAASESQAARVLTAWGDPDIEGTSELPQSRDGLRRIAVSDGPEWKEP